MKTKVIKWDSQKGFLPDDLLVLSKAIRNGELVAFPTETVYGLGGNGLSEQASHKIYEAKGRPSDNPLILHISSMNELAPIVQEVTPAATKLAEAFWPGPLTMILPKADCVPLTTTGGLMTVAVRMPSHEAARELIAASKVPIAAPSANTSGRPSPTRAEHVLEDMQGRIPYIIDGGEVGIGIESTIVDLTEHIPVILRPGYISKEMLEEVVGEVRLDATLLMDGTKENVHPKAPGMNYRHYAPKAQMSIIEGESQDVISWINHEIDTHKEADIGVLASELTKKYYHGDCVLALGNQADHESVAHDLYAALREFDQRKVSYIYSESFANADMGFAVMNRLTKAAGHRKIQAGHQGTHMNGD